MCNVCFQAYVDKAFNREILELDVKCNNHEWGCMWEGEFQKALVSFIPISRL